LTAEKYVSGIHRKQEEEEEIKSYEEPARKGY